MRANRPGTPSRGLDLSLLAFVSGAAGLVYESLWMRAFGLVFGNTTDAVAAVLATFMGGLALGGALCSRKAARRPLRTYAAVELGVGLTAALTVPLLRLLPQAAAALGGGGSVAARVLGAALVVLPTTLCMGATVPLLVAEQARRGTPLAGTFGRLYLVNTLGGACGVALGGFLLVPTFGVTLTALTAACANLLIANTARRMANEAGDAAVPVEAPAETAAFPALAAPCLLALVSGTVSFALEVLWTRSFALVIGSSVYAFDLMLLAFLLGLVLGALAFVRLLPDLPQPGVLVGRVYVAVGVTALATTAAIGWLPLVLLALMKVIPLSFAAHQLAGFLLCFLTMLPATFGFGLAFPLLARLLPAHAPQRGAALLYAANTAGAITGALAADLVLVPRHGLQGPAALVAGLLVATGLWPMLPGRPRAVRAMASVLVLAAAAIGLTRFRPWDPLVATSGVYKYGLAWKDTMPSAFSLSARLHGDRRLLLYEEGREAVVAVTESTTSGHRFLSLNGKTDAGTGPEDVLTQKYLGHVTMLHHPAPRRVMVIGWGAGATVAATALHPGVQQVTCVEIEEATWKAAPLFADLLGPLLHDPRLRVEIGDGRNRLLQSGERWDVIVSEPSNPWISGVSNLFTREFYEVVRSHLAPRGVFGQWFHYYNLKDEDVRTELRTFVAVFPHSSLWLVPPVGSGSGTQLTADVLLVGSDTPLEIDGERLDQAFAGAVGRDLAATGAVDGAAALLATWAMGTRDLKRFAGQGPLNTDDFPWLEFHAPRSNVADPAHVVAQALALYAALGAAGEELLPSVRRAAGGADAALLADVGGRQARMAQPERAARLLTAALAADPDRAAAQSDLGEVLLARGRPQEAEAHLRRAVALEPARLEAWNLLGGLLIDRQDLAAAEDVHREMLRLHPTFVAGHLRLAAVLARRGSFRSARAELEEAKRLDPAATVDPQLVAWLDQQAAAAGAP